MLRDLLAADIYRLMLLFARLGAAFMLMPVFGNSAVFVRARLLIALLFAFLMLPVLGGRLPPMPVSPLALFVLILSEVTIGLFFGVMMQMLLTPVDLAGSFISYSVGISNAFIFDANLQQQSQVMTGFLTLTAITLVVAVDAHHLMLRGLVGTYDVFQPGEGLPTADLAQTMARTGADAFRVGLELAAPLVVFSFAFNTGLGLVNRLVPQMQVFFVGMPLQILGGIFLLGVCLSAIMMWAVRFFVDGANAFRGAL